MKLNLGAFTIEVSCGDNIGGVHQHRITSAQCICPRERLEEFVLHLVIEEGAETGDARERVAGQVPMPISTEGFFVDGHKKFNVSF